MRTTMSTRFILGVAILVLCSGCSTVLSHTATDSVVGPYSGVRLDCDLIGSANEKNPDFGATPWIIPFCVIDIPLSAALDTVFLPYDLFQHQPETQSNTNQPANRCSQQPPRRPVDRL